MGHDPKNIKGADRCRSAPSKFIQTISGGTIGPPINLPPDIDRAATGQPKPALKGRGAGKPASRRGHSKTKFRNLKKIYPKN
jgi:hypothetical protein